MGMGDMQRLERTGRMMVSWMCGVSLKSRMSSKKLNARLGIEAVSEIVRRGRLRWYGHIERKGSDDWCLLAETMRWLGKRAGAGVERPGMLFTKGRTVYDRPTVSVDRTV